MKLEEGEMICDKCNGRGIIPKIIIPKGEICTALFCRKCKGTGKLDWIENVVGKKPCRYIKPGLYIREIDISEYIGEMK